METIIFRADASTTIGSGHFMRCLALGQAWKDSGGRVVFITNCKEEGLLGRLRQEEFGIHILSQSYPDSADWEYTGGFLADCAGAWVVLDGYYFDETYQQYVKDSGHRLLVIDDMAHLKHYYADIVLNQNLSAEELHYVCEPDTRLLLGTQYVLLRREFLDYGDRKCEVPEVACRVLVTLGGGDHDNVTLRVVEALQEVEVPGLEATVVVGGSNPHAATLEAAARQSRIPIRITRDARNMPELMAEADAAVAGAGSTVWELAWMGVPSILLMQADNQVRVADALHKSGVVLSMGWAYQVETHKLAEKLASFLLDVKGRSAMVQQAGALVDGEGASRVVMHITGAKLRLRRACKEDCRLLWEWANDPGVRVASFSSEPISWEEHARWFDAKLNDPHCFHFIGLDDKDTPWGQVRFDLRGSEAEIDVSVVRQRRRHDYGTHIIQTATQKMFLLAPVRIVHAYVKPDNVASIQAFTRAGFHNCGSRKIVRGYEAMHFSRSRDDG